MLEQRHNTHALSSFNSSSNTHSYDFDNRNKLEKIQKPINITDNLTLLSNVQINRVNDILVKYNLISEKSSNKEEKNISKIKKATSSDVLSKDKTEVKIEEKKIDDYFYNKFTETTRSDNKIKDLLSYKNNPRETRFNNIQKFLEEENKIQQKKGDKNNKIFLYQQTPSSRNLIRSIKKPRMSFITKIFKNFSMMISKNYDMFSGIKLNVKNNVCFYTKKIIKREEFVEAEKKFNKEKYEKLKKEVEAEKIPTFSSINTSSSNESTSKIKIKAKTKLKSNLKKKKNKHKTSKPKQSPKRKKLLLPKYNKPIRSISVHSRFSNESSRTRQTNKIINLKKDSGNIKKKQFGLQKNTRKYSIITRLQEKFLNKRSDSNKIASSNSLRNMNNFRSPFRDNLLNINKPTEEANNDKDKENAEKDFKHFLEEQKIKRNNQIKNFMKKQGMNSYNFFYPKEPSPLLSIFKNKYSLYPTLNINRRSSLEKEEKKLMKEANKTNFYESYRNEKISLKKLREKEKKEISKIHLIEKHYGNEKDCPLCRIFQLRREKEKEKEKINSNIEYIKSMKYNKFLGMLSPNPQVGINLKKDFELMSRNRINSAREFGPNNQESSVNKNFNVLFEYLMM